MMVLCKQQSPTVRGIARNHARYLRLCNEPALRKEAAAGAATAELSLPARRMVAAEIIAEVTKGVDGRGERMEPRTTKQGGLTTTSVQRPEIGQSNTRVCLLTYRRQSSRASTIRLRGAVGNFSFDALVR